jgi:hypothetical protein
MRLEECFDFFFTFKVEFSLHLGRIYNTENVRSDRKSNSNALLDMHIKFSKKFQLTYLFIHRLYAKRNLSIVYDGLDVTNSEKEYIIIIVIVLTYIFIIVIPVCFSLFYLK